MALMEWNDNLSVKVARFDTEHKKLIDMLNELHDAMKVGKGSEVLGTVLNKLINYTSLHFHAEESIMNQYGYPDLALHKAEHRKLVDQVLVIQKQFGEGKAFPPTVLQFLREWLSTHIMGDDKKYGVYLNSKGVV